MKSFILKYKKLLIPLIISIIFAIVLLIIVIFNYIPNFIKKSKFEKIILYLLSKLIPTITIPVLHITCSLHFWTKYQCIHQGKWNPHKTREQKMSSET